jgi:hypothetical protein
VTVTVFVLYLVSAAVLSVLYAVINSSAVAVSPVGVDGGVFGVVVGVDVGWLVVEGVVGEVVDLKSNVPLVAIPRPPAANTSSAIMATIHIKPDEPDFLGAP